MSDSAACAKDSRVFYAVVWWQQKFGRQGLPWQGTRDPYRVWLSEIMLQQTQVLTVLGYYDRFLSRFPDVHSLAYASVDDVLAMWSGLGYYSRAINLHRCAQTLVREFSGEFPRSSDVLQELPGIGPSTASAIAAFCFGETTSIFDGNVKRVMARWLGFTGDISHSPTERELKTQVQDLVPQEASAKDMACYTQGLMDLGATVCTRSKPRCSSCPLAQDCVALEVGRPQEFPCKTRRLKRSTQIWFLLVVRRANGECWLEKRAPSGIWASLYCFPVLLSREELLAKLHENDLVSAQEMEPVVHALTHRDLVLTPVVCQVPAGWHFDKETALRGRWVHPSQASEVGLPTPIACWLAEGGGLERL